MPELLVVTPTFFPEVVGTPHYIADLVRWLDKQGWRVRVVTAQPFYPDFQRFSGYGRTTRHDSMEGTNIYRLPTVIPRAGSTMWRVINEGNFLCQGYIAGRLNRIRKSRIVISVSAGTPGTIILGRSLTAKGGRHIALVHDLQAGLAKELGMATGPALNAIRRFERYALNRADVLHVLSDEMRHVVRGLDVYSPIVVTPIWATIAPPKATVTEQALVQYSGNLGRKQGVSQLLALATNLNAALPQERLLIRGCGPMLATLREAQSARSLVNMTFAPLVPSSELAQALASSPIHVVPQQPNCSAFVMPSKVINALAAGATVVAAAPSNSTLASMAGRCPALRCVSPGDVKAMTDNVVNLASNRSLLYTLTNEAREFARLAFDRQRILTTFARSLQSAHDRN